MRLIVVWLVKLPEVPAMVTVTVPMAAVADAVSVSAVEAGSGLEPKKALTPLGRPVTASSSRFGCSSLGST